ncbi:hypothetical protein RchiOBHm_Chr7g0209121 [Rosa chinensis]|uniref:Uncharacterized protein n=1 Tax=Rosa chinensis TaxID=74649 RepID=A0A2P6P9W6_ROSCH|nr:hypothetical protein RchiOBHm_Chr7g0209121 [Rosa chinensis]
MKVKKKSSVAADSVKEQQKKQKGKMKMKIPEAKQEKQQPEEVDSDSVYDSGAEDERSLSNHERMNCWYVQCLLLLSFCLFRGLVMTSWLN